VSEVKAGDMKVLQRYELKGGLPHMVLGEASINFLVGRKAKVLRIDGDLAHIEVRLSERDIMMLRWPVEALMDLGDDPHVAVAAAMFNVKKEEVTKTQRGEAMKWGFGLMYGRKEK
jgi:hypothetical protein